MAETGVLLTILGLTFALPGICTSSLGPWFCYRLVPPSITSAITPCMFPCLFISPHEHPHIVVHSEVDGTPCKVTSGLGHQTKVGRCSNGVCNVKMGLPVLKRKKRFICLLTLAQLLKARRERKLLRSELQRLRELAMLNYHRSANYASGGRVGSHPLNRLRGQGSRGSSSDNSEPNVVEIHILGPEAGGTSAYHPVPGRSGSVHLANSVGGRNRGGSVRYGVAGRPNFLNVGGERVNGGHNDFPTERIEGVGGAGVIPGSTDISVTTGSGNAGVANGGPVTSGATVVANVGVGNNDAGSANGGNSIATVVATSAGTTGNEDGRIPGYSGRDFENRRGVATLGGASGGRVRVASAVGVAGVGVRHGFRGRVGPGSVRHRARGAETGNVGRIGDLLSSAATGAGNNVRYGVGAVGTSYAVERTPSAPGISESRSLFPSSDGRVSGGVVGRGSGMDLESGSSRGNRFFGPTGGIGDNSDSRRFENEDFGSGDDFAGDDGL